MADDTSQSDIDAFLSKNSMNPGAKFASAVPASAAPPGATASPQPGAGPAVPAVDLNKFPSLPTPKYHDIPKAPQQQYDDPMKAFGGPAIFLMALGSLVTRHPIKVAMDSASAMIAGNVKGQNEQHALQQENYRMAVEQTVAQNKVEQQRYQAIMAKYQDNTNAMLAHLASTAAGFNDPLLLGLVRTGKIDEAEKIINDRNTQALKLQQMTNGMLDYSTLNEMAGQYLAGDKSVFQNIGRGAQGSQNIASLRSIIANKMKEDGVSPQEQARKMQEFQAAQAGMSSEARAVGTNTANLDLIAKNVEAAIPAALDASKALPRGQFVPINKLMQMGEEQLSDPRLAALKQSTLQVAELWARAMNPKGVMRESDRDMALKNLSTATTPELYEQQIKGVEQFVKRELGVSERTKQETFGGGQKSTAPPPNATPQVGEIRKGYRFKGGDPSSRDSWEAVH